VIIDTAGNFDDLWIRRINDNLRIFTGVSTYGASLAGLPMPDEDEFRQSRKQKAERENYKNGGWYKDLTRLDELQKDDDKDGLTDLVEKRFGTKPENADSDTDGLRDDVDAWPLTALRALSDEEKLLSLAFLAAEPRDFVLYSTVGQSSLPQLGSAGARIFPSDSGSKPRGLISDLFGFESSSRDKPAQIYSDCIEYSSDRTIAKVSFRMSFHGDTAIFRKVRNRWILVDVKMRWIS
jgi:hypothetical protein